MQFVFGLWVGAILSLASWMWLGGTVPAHLLVRFETIVYFAASMTVLALVSFGLVGFGQGMIQYVRESRLWVGRVQGQQRNRGRS